MQILRGRTFAIDSLAVSSDSRWLAAAGSGACHAWDLHQPKAKPRPVFPKTGTLAKLQFTAPAVLFAYLDEGWHRHDLSDGSGVAFALPNTPLPHFSILHPSGELLKAPRRGSNFQTYRVTAEGLGPEVSQCSVPRYALPLGYDPSGGHYLMEACLPSEATKFYHVFDSATDAALTTFERAPSDRAFGMLRAWCFSPDGRRLYLGTTNQPIDYGSESVILRTITDPYVAATHMLYGYDCAAGGLPVVAVPLPPNSGRQMIAAHPDGRVLATVEGESAVTFRDAESLEVLRSYDFKMPKVTSVAFTPDGTRCVLGNNRGKVLLFDVE